MARKGMRGTGQRVRGETAGPSPAKAKTILKDGKVKGKALTGKQRGYFGARAGGAPMPGAM